MPTLELGVEPPGDGFRDRRRMSKTSNGGAGSRLFTQADDVRFDETVKEIAASQAALLASMQLLHAKVDTLTAGAGVSPGGGAGAIGYSPGGGVGGGVLNAGRSAPSPRHSFALLKTALTRDETAMLRHSSDGPQSNYRRPNAGSIMRTVHTMQSQSSSVHGMEMILPEGWPRTLKRREPAREGKSTQAQSVLNAIFSSEPSDLGLSVGVSRINRMRDPNMMFYSFFDGFGFLVLFYDLTIVPYIVAWNIEISSTFLLLAWCSVVYWTIDVLLNFFKGFYRNMTLILSYRRIAHRYTTSWFILDISLVLGDWLSLTQETMGGYKMLRVTKVLKTSRVFMALKLLRVVKIRRQLAALEDSQHFNNLRVGAFLSIILLGTVWVNHLIGCAWFMAGDWAPTDTGRRWLDSDVIYMGETTTYREVGEAFQYATALHWALAQSTLGAMEIIPSNTAERLITIACLLFGLLVGSTIVSSMSASMVHMQMAMRERQRQLRNLQRFLTENGVTSPVSTKVEMMIQQRLRTRSRLTPDDVPCLGLLPASLKEMLHTEVCTPLLIKHPLLRFARHFSSARFQMLCVESISILHPRSSDELFFPGDVAKGAYCIVSGELQYERVKPLHDSGDSLVRDSNTLEDGAWLAEAAIWVEWTHVGKAQTVKDSQLLLIDGARFVEVLMSHGPCSRMAVEYSRGYFDRITALSQDPLNMPDDLAVPCTDFADIVRSMPVELRMKVATATFEVQEKAPSLIIGKWSSSIEMTPLMKSEVSKGAAVFVPDSANQVKRVVSVAVLRLCNSDGRFLAQIATVPAPPAQDGASDSDDGAAASAQVAIAECRLPGTKQQGGETTQDSIRRFLCTKLRPFSELVEWERIEQDTTKKRSDRSQFLTIYVRSICSATFIGDPKMFVSSELGLSRSSGVYDEMPERLRGLPLYYFSSSSSSGGGGIYTWLDNQKFDFFKSSEGTAQLQTWLSGLGPLELPGDIESESHDSVV